MSKEEKIKVEVVIGPATVRVEAPPDKLEEAVRNAVSALKSVYPQLGAEAARMLQERGAKEKKAGRKPTPTCSGLLRGLIEEGWFDEARALSEVVQELAKRGYHYDPTAVSHSLLDLVRERSLIREGAPRRYTYRKAASSSTSQSSP